MRISSAIQAVSIVALVAGAAIGAGPKGTLGGALKGAKSVPQASPVLASPSVASPTVMTRLAFETPSDARRANHAQRGGVEHSTAREWNEVLLHAIRNDYARPTVHSRNLYHISAGMWDAWSAYDTERSDQVFHHEKLGAKDIEGARNEAISFVTYRIIQHRFLTSPGMVTTYEQADLLMDELGYDKDFTSTIGNTPAALGNRIAESIIAMGLTDGANESGADGGEAYGNLYYEPFNPPLLPDFAGNPDIVDPNRWQPLALEYFVDQSGNPIPTGYPGFLSPEWGDVTPFALNELDMSVYNRDGNDWTVWSDPGAPPMLGNSEAEDERYKWGNEMVSVWSSHLDPADGVMIDISPGAIGNSPLAAVEDEQAYYNYLEGGDSGQGWDINPTTGEAYEPQIVPRGDYGRILAEFWADGPDSETPPGHWFTLLNYVSDHPAHEDRFMGDGPIIDQLQWDVKSYLIMGAGMHDIAISSWSVKGWYDYIRPISALRYLCDLGQCTDDTLPSFDEDGVNLQDGYIELVTAASIAPGERHEHLGLAGINKIAILAWRGPDFIIDEDTDVAGVGWILAENWWPYQRPSFVTPPFAGYVSGHSTYSRGAAEIMTILTGDAYFPGGMGEFLAPMNEFLVFEDGPSVDVVLQWATYRDASDQCSLSRIWGGIHPPADDLPGRHMGEYLGPNAFTHARKVFNGQVSCPADYQRSGTLNIFDILAFIDDLQEQDPLADMNRDGTFDFFDVALFLEAFNNGCP